MPASLPVSSESRQGARSQFQISTPKACYAPRGYLWEQMKALWILGAVVVITVGLPALGHMIRRIIGRPLTPEQIERDALLEERRRDALYFWR